MIHDTPPRRRVPRALREHLYLRSEGTCEHGCGSSITLETFHVSHLRAHASGGALVEENLEAWCSRCNLTQGARDVRDTRLSPREWQLEALDPVVARIIADGAATVSAAPGAGKTIFAGLVFEALYEQDIVDRLVVLAPRRALVDQWADALRRARQLELKPHAELERGGQYGVVATYQSLQNIDAVQVHQVQARTARTLLVLDEVHHIGEPIAGHPPAWARNVASLAGTVDQDLHVAGVLNLSGTLWRSAAGERISTVRYRSTGDNRLESLVDYEVPAERLIQAGELRPLDLYRLDARIRMADMAKLEYIESNMADLDERPARAAVAGLATKAGWRGPFVKAILDRLEVAHRDLEGHHVKALIVAARQEDARLFQAEINEQMSARGLRPLAEIATSDEEAPGRVLEEFKRSTRVGVLCTVDMAGEGYDCPDIVVIGYASDKLTTLYVRQVVARAMRVTAVERALGRIIPASIVVPDVPVLVERLVGYLAPFTHEIFMPEGVSPEPGFDRDGNPLLSLPLARYILDEVSPTDETVTIAHSDGSVDNFTGEMVRRLAEQLQALNVPTSYAPRMLAAARRTVGDLLDSRPFDRLDPDAAALDSLTSAPQQKAETQNSEMQHFDSIEDRCEILQRQLRKLEGWWHINGDTPVANLGYEANRIAGIPNGGRGSATAAQLERALEHERRLIAGYCARTNKPLPRARS